MFQGSSAALPRQHLRLSLPTERWLDASALTTLRCNPLARQWHACRGLANRNTSLIPQCWEYHKIRRHRHLGSALLNAVEGQVIKPLHLRNLASVVPLQELLKPPASLQPFNGGRPARCLGAANPGKICQRAPSQLQSPDASECCRKSGRACRKLPSMHTALNPNYGNSRRLTDCYEPHLCYLQRADGLPLLLIMHTTRQYDSLIYGNIS